MKFSQRRLLLAGLSCAALFGAGAACAQEQARALPAPVEMIRGCPCSNPVNIQIDKNSGTTSGLASDFPAVARLNQMTYNDMGHDKHFTDTIYWKLPTDTCEFQSAKVSWTVKNNANNPIQNNDGTSLYYGGVSIPGSAHPVGALAAGATRTFTQNLTGVQVKNGHVSLFVQDDTAVIDFHVAITGCCIRPN